MKTPGVKGEDLSKWNTVELGIQWDLNVMHALKYIIEFEQNRIYNAFN